MQPNNDTIKFRREELKGSRLRCMMYTTGSPTQVADRLTRLIALPDVVVGAGNLFMPRGFLLKEEARLGETPGFLTDDQRNLVTHWWLQVVPGANTPNWDIAAKATIGGQPGLVLVEAKAHANELKTAGKNEEGNELNHKQIGKAIQAANDGLKPILAGWELSRDSHYQLSNRFAWSWMIASLGVPVVLVYLGFLNADEMPNPFPSTASWADCVQAWSSGRVPAGAWGTQIMVKGTPFIPLIRTPFIPLIRAVEVLFEPSTP